MSNDPLKFWITCPNCKTPFGVEPRSILQYLHRVIDAKAGGASREKEREKRGEVASHATDERADSPAPKAPYQPPYRKWKR